MSKALMKPLTEEQLEQMRQMYPIETTFSKVFLPRLGMLSQDVIEGKGRNMKVVSEAGTFFIESQTDEKDEDGKNVWVRKEIGDSIEAIILYQRKQLRSYDESTQLYTSSPIFDEETDVIPLFCNKAEVAKGTPPELRAKYQYKDKDGKTRTSLEDNKILYVLYEGEVYQMNLRGSSMYSFMSYTRKGIIPPSVVTKFTSEPQEKGSIKWNKMMFDEVRPVTSQEAELVMECIEKIRDGIAQERASFQR